MSHQPIKVVIVDDHAGVRAGIRNLILTAKDIIVVGEGVNGVEALRLAETEKPDVMLLDVELPILKGDEVVRRIHRSQPKVKVLAVSSYNDPLYIQGMLENGASGYIVKEEAPELLLEAIHTIFTSDHRWMSPLAAKSIGKYSHPMI